MNRILIRCPPELLLRSASSKKVIQKTNFMSDGFQSLFSNKTSRTTSVQQRLYKAAICTELNKPLTIGVKESQELSSGEVRVQVAAVGINFGDLLMLTGEYQVKLPLPFTPGSEMSGTVLEVADDVENLKPGMRVMGLCTAFGAFAEEVVTPVDGLWKIPEKMSFTEAASFVTSYGTAMLGLSRRANLQKNETVVVTAAAGAVGLAAVDIASNVFNANVIGAAGSDEKCSLVKSKGANNAIDYRKDNLRNKLKEICPDGVDVVFDAVGGSAFKDTFRCLKFEGKMVVVGFASGEIPQIPANHVLVKNISVVGLYWGSYSMNNMDVFKWSIDKCFEEYNNNKIHPHTCKSFCLNEINDAFQFVQSRKSTGKVVIEIRP